MRIRIEIGPRANRPIPSGVVTKMGFWLKNSRMSRHGTVTPPHKSAPKVYFDEAVSRFVTGPNNAKGARTGLKDATSVLFLSLLANVYIDATEAFVIT